MITDEQEGVSVFYCKKKEIIDSVRNMIIKAGLEHYILPDLDHETDDPHEKHGPEAPKFQEGERVVVDFGGEPEDTATVIRYRHTQQEGDYKGGYVYDIQRHQDKEEYTVGETCITKWV